MEAHFGLVEARTEVVVLPEHQHNGRGLYYSWDHGVFELPTIARFSRIKPSEELAAAGQLLLSLIKDGYAYCRCGVIVGPLEAVGDNCPWCEGWCPSCLHETGGARECDNCGAVPPSPNRGKERVRLSRLRRAQAARRIGLRPPA